MVNPDINALFNRYPSPVRQQLERVRDLIFAQAAEHQLGEVAESLKWGEASFQVKGGTPIRMDWKPDDPDSIKLFFSLPDPNDRNTQRAVSR